MSDGPPDQNASNETSGTSRPLGELARLFLKLGVIAFGGPAAHIAMLEDEVVTRRGWLSRQHFLDLVGATNLIPGPNSTEMTMHVGYERAGWKGLFTAGACFILPAVLITGGFAWLYVSYGSLPEVEPFLYAVNVAAVALMVAVTIELGVGTLVSWHAWIIAALATGLALVFRVNAAWLVLKGAVLGWLLYGWV